MHEISVLLPFVVGLVVESTLHATWNAICDGGSLSWCGLRAGCGRRFTIYKVHKASKKKREKSSAKKERKATKTLAIVLGKSRLTHTHTQKNEKKETKNEKPKPKKRKEKCFYCG